MVYDDTPKYYVYAWYIKETEEVFYVGKGTGKRYKTRKRENPLFMRIINKYECDVKILKDNMTEKEAFEYEIKMIAYYRSVSTKMANFLDGGENPPKLTGIPKSEEWKKKVREANKIFHKNNPDVSKRQSENFKAFLQTEEGKKFAEKSKKARSTEEFKKKQSEICRKANNTEEYLKRQSEIVKNMWKSEEYKDAHMGKNNGRAQGVEQYSLEGELLNIYETITEASIKTNVCASKISCVCNGKRKTTGGFIWKYHGEKRNDTVERKYSYDALHDKNAKAIIQYDLNGKIINEYNSIADAVKINETYSRPNLIACLKGRTKTAYGYVWKYKQDDTVPSL